MLGNHGYLSHDFSTYYIDQFMFRFHQPPRPPHAFPSLGGPRLVVSCMRVCRWRASYRHFRGSAARLWYELRGYGVVGELYRRFGVDNRAGYHVPGPQPFASQHLWQSNGRKTQLRVIPLRASCRTKAVTIFSCQRDGLISKYQAANHRASVCDVSVRSFFLGGKVRC